MIISSIYIITNKCPDNNVIRTMIITLHFLSNQLQFECILLSYSLNKLLIINTLIFSFEEEMTREELFRMFPYVNRDIISDILFANRGNVDATIEYLLEMNEMSNFQIQIDDFTIPQEYVPQSMNSYLDIINHTS